MEFSEVLKSWDFAEPPAAGGEKIQMFGPPPSVGHCLWGRELRFRDVDKRDLVGGGDFVQGVFATTNPFINRVKLPASYGITMGKPHFHELGGTRGGGTGGEGGSCFTICK